MSTLASLVQMVSGDRWQVVNLVPVGASPEDYQPSPRDIEALRRAQILVENGAGIEVWLNHLLDAARNINMQVVVATQGVQLKDGNPHVWMDPVAAQEYLKKIEAALERADPEGTPYYRTRLQTAIQQLQALDAAVRSQIKTIPPGARNMIVFHNAWQYYADRYSLRVVGAIELSPGQEPSPQYLSKLVKLAKSHHVRVIFAEPEYNKKLATVLGESAGIKTVSNLYDDSLGTSPEVKDYISLITYDTNVIVNALK